MSNNLKYLHDRMANQKEQYCLILTFISDWQIYKMAGSNLLEAFKNKCV